MEIEDFQQQGVQQPVQENLEIEASSENNNDNYDKSVFKLSDEELAKIPSEFYSDKFMDCITSGFQAIVYNAHGFLYFFKHHLYKIFILDVLLIIGGVILSALISGGLAFALVFTLWSTLFQRYVGIYIRQPYNAILTAIVCVVFTVSVAILFFVLALYFGVKILLQPNLSRLSNVVEKIMQGKTKNLGFACCGDGCNCCIDFFWSLVTNVLNIIMIIICHCFVLPILLAIVDVIPGVGQILAMIVTWSVLSYELGVLSFGVVLYRKKKNSFKMMGWCLQPRNIPVIIGYGFGEMIIYLIPIINIFHGLFTMFSGVIGTTRLYVHIEYARQNKIETVTVGNTQNFQVQQQFHKPQFQQQQNQFAVQQDFVQPIVVQPAIVQPQQQFVPIQPQFAGNPQNNVVTQDQNQQIQYVAPQTTQVDLK